MEGKLEVFVIWYLSYVNVLHTKKILNQNGYKNKLKIDGRVCIRLITKTFSEKN
jgi:hypothetical protein